MSAGKIHMVGISGVGMSGLAQMLKSQGFEITGTDNLWFPTIQAVEKAGIAVTIGYDAKNVPEGTDALVHTDAAFEDNPERMEAVRRNIPQLSYFKMLGRISSGKRTVAIAGTHGKTTTTGMLAKILHQAGANVPAIIGSIVEDFGSNYLPGTSDFFVVEACEYRDHLLELSPEILVITNLEWDHTDYFPTLAALQATFRKAIERVPASGFIITDPNATNIEPLLENAAATVIDYTQEQVYTLRLPGGFNQDNARAAASAARAVMPGIPESTIVDALASFKGTWRRFQYKGTLEVAGGQADVYDDYAHHPTAVQETLEALRQKLEVEGTGGAPRIIVAFHPHLYSRTRDLLDGFSRAFGAADEVIIAPIYAAREADDGSVSSELLADRIRAEGVSARAASSLEDVEHLLRGMAQSGDTIITMGAGDIYKVADALVTPKG